MAKLSHIDDFNNDDLDEAINKAAAQTKKNLDRKQKAGVQDEQSAQASSMQAESKQGRPKQGAPEQSKSRSEQARPKVADGSEDDDDVPFQTGQKFIAVIAFVALVAVILYILNYWFHFV